MCNRAKYYDEPETLRETFGAKWWVNRPMDNRFNPREFAPSSRNWIIRMEDGQRGIDVMTWDLLGGMAKYEITNVRDLARWRPRLERPEGRCLIPLTEFAEWTPERHNLGDGKRPLKGEMWFNVIDQPIFAVAGVWQPLGDKHCFAMMTCDPNELVAPIHPKAMITILHPEDHERWLTGSYDDVVALQRPYPADQMTVRGPLFPTRGVG
jgi:putative SOS response-associated peptidase YedK